MINSKKNLEELTIALKDSEISEEYKERVLSFFKILKKDSGARLIFRGDDIEKMKNLYGVKNVLDSKFNQTLFMIGNKGRNYQKKFNEKIKKDGKKFLINEISDKIFEYIFKKFKRIFKNNKGEIKEFKEKNKEFVSFFSDNKNKNIFIKEVGKLGNNDKIKLRDYYFVILHTYGLIGFGYNSFFLSATEKYKIAQGFSNGMISLGWIPNGYEYYQHINNLRDDINNKIFPVATNKFHADQYEFTLKGGWLPHFLLGYILTNDNRMILNDNFFKDCNTDNNLILNNGIKIDQSDFNMFIKETGYSSAFWVDNHEAVDIAV